MWVHSLLPFHLVSNHIPRPKHFYFQLVNSIEIANIGVFKWPTLCFCWPMQYPRRNGAYFSCILSLLLVSTLYTVLMSSEVSLYSFYSLPLRIHYIKRLGLDSHVRSWHISMEPMLLMCQCDPAYSLDLSNETHKIRSGIGRSLLYVISPF